MGSYAYCQHKGCHLGLDKPTIRQGLGLEGWSCASGHDNEVWTSGKETIADEFERLTERIERIEAKLGGL